MTAPKLQNPDVERFVLGAILDSDGVAQRKDNAALLASLGLVAEDFTDRRLRALYGVVAALVESGTPVEPETVTGAARALLRESPYRELVELRANNTATISVLHIHAKTLKRLTALRDLEAHYRAQLEAMAATTANAFELMENSGRFFKEKASNHPEDESGDVDVAELAEEWEAFLEGKRHPYLRTGVESLDSVFNGFVPNLNLIGGRASGGKTALVAEMVMTWLRGGKSIGLFGLEDGTGWLLRRHLSRRLGIPVGEVGASRLHEHGWEDYSTSMQEFQNLFRERLHVYRRGGITAEKLLAIARRWIYVNKVKAIVVDHGGEIRHEGKHNRDRFDLAVRASMEGLRDLALATHTPVIVLWHLNREGAKAGQPTMEAFKESGYLEAMARTMLGIWERPDKNPEELLVTVVKATNGRRDITAVVEKEFKHGLVKSSGGYALDLRREAEEMRQQEEDSRRTKAKKVRLFGPEVRSDAS